MDDMREQRNLYALYAIIFLAAFIALVVINYVVVIPGLLDQVCHAYGYGNVVNYVFENYGYALASLRCQGTLNPVKVI